jgi:hypothetical protein
MVIRPFLHAREKHDDGDSNHDEKTDGFQQEAEVDQEPETGLEGDREADKAAREGDAGSPVRAAGRAGAGRHEVD